MGNCGSKEPSTNPQLSVETSTADTSSGSSGSDSSPGSTPKHDYRSQHPHAPVEPTPRTNTGIHDTVITAPLDSLSFFDGAVFTVDNPGKINDFYTIDPKMLGEGTYGAVYACQPKVQGASTRVVKKISKKLGKDEKKRLDIEIQLMKLMDHPNVVKLYETFSDNNDLYLVMEKCDGGELFDKIIEVSEKGGFNEKQCANIMKQMIGVVYYMHTRGVMHRDLKPENFLFLEKNAPMETATMKIIDFGLSAKFQPGKFAKTRAGTPYYVAPQVLQGQYNEKCDVWSCGVIMYVLLCGYPPFAGDTDADVLAKVKQGVYYFDKKDWEGISEDAMNLIKGMMKKDPTERLTAQQAFEHPWIQQKAPNQKLRSLPKNFVASLQHFAGGNKLKKAALHVIAAHMTDDQVADLLAIWKALDADGNGTLTKDEIKAGVESLPDHLPKDQVKQIMDLVQSLDTDGSGAIDYTEFIAATLDQQKFLKEDMLRKAFNTFDLNGDGFISKEELDTVLSSGKVDSHVDAQAVAQIMAEADENGDGKISFDEFMNMMKKQPGLADGY